MKTANLKPLNLFAQLVRSDDDERIVEGYCFVNEEVGDGFRLTRAAMERAAEEYMRFPAVREMHGRNAVGTGTVEFDDKGAYFRAKVVDDEAWKKVKEGVYRGFSVGVNPIIVRGKDVLEAKWIETSLVDRPRDWDSEFVVFRAEERPEVCRALELEESEEVTGSVYDTVMARVAVLEAEVEATQAALEAETAAKTAAEEAKAAAEKTATELQSKVNELESQSDQTQEKPALKTKAVDREFSDEKVDDQKSAGDYQRELAEIQAKDWSKEPEAERNRAFARVQELKSLI